MDIDHPFHIDERGRTATTGPEDHIRDLLEQLLFTNRGERVNQPEFGGGLIELLFAPNGPEVATALQGVVGSAVGRWLGDLIELLSLEIEQSDGRLGLTVGYVILQTGERRVQRLTQEGTG